jgi:succinate dehydrogenase / fumarate reductase cytochrome b subunit
MGIGPTRRRERHGSRREKRMNRPLDLVPKTSLGSKYVMAVTGLGLVGFVIVHMLGNLQLFLGRDALNSYAQALKHNPEILWGARAGLLTIFVLHIIYGVWLTLRNRAARPIPYAFTKQYREATFASRTMIITGLVLLAFVIFHLAHYTVGVIGTVQQTDLVTGEVKEVPLTDLKDLKDPKDPRHDVYNMTVYGFRNPFVSVSYILAMAFLALHLSHGFQSCFQSLGLNHPRWMPLLKKTSLALALIIFIGNISMPLAVLFRLVGKDVP